MKTLWVIPALLIASAAPAADVSFMSDVAPVLVQRCGACHGPQKNKGDFRLDTFDGLLQPGNSDAKPIVAGKPDESEVVRRIAAADPGKRMPPGAAPLLAAEIDQIKTWIAAGARFDGPDRGADLRASLPPRKHPASPDVYRVPVPVFAVAFSPDGKELAVGGHNEVTIWDPETGQLRRRLPHLPQRIHALAYRRDGTALLVGGGTPGEYGEVLLVNAADGTKVRTFATFDDVVLGACFSADESRVAAGSADRSTRAFAADGRALWRMQLHGDWVTAVSFSPDGRFVAAAGKDRTIKVFEVETGTFYTSYTGHAQEYGAHRGRFAVYDVAFAADGTAYSAGEGPEARVWDPDKALSENGSAADMEERFVKVGHTQYLAHGAARPVYKLCVRGGDVFTVSGDGVVRQHSAADRTLVRVYRGHTDWLFALDVNSATKRAASAGFGGEVRVWDTDSGRCVIAFTAAPGYWR
jgi:WD40 repeat protein